MRSQNLENQENITVMTARGIHYFFIQPLAESVQNNAKKLSRHFKGKQPKLSAEKIMLRKYPDLHIRYNANNCSHSLFLI
jgi:hypothetical protein